MTSLFFLEKRKKRENMQYFLTNWFFMEINFYKAVLTTNPEFSWSQGDDCIFWIDIMPGPHILSKIGLTKASFYDKTRESNDKTHLNFSWFKNLGEHVYWPFIFKNYTHFFQLSIMSTFSQNSIISLECFQPVLLYQKKRGCVLNFQLEYKITTLLAFST